MADEKTDGSKSLAGVESSDLQQPESDSASDTIDRTILALDSLAVFNEMISGVVDVNSNQASSAQPKAESSSNSLKEKEKSLPAPEIMVRKIQRRLNANIKQLLKLAQGELARKITKGTAYELSETVSKIRKLKITLYKLVIASPEYIKALYIQLFRPQKHS
jgi:hypothetical protein